MALLSSPESSLRAMQFLRSLGMLSSMLLKVTMSFSPSVCIASLYLWSLFCPFTVKTEDNFFVIDSMDLAGVNTSSPFYVDNKSS